MDKVIFTFNKFFYDLVQDLKDVSPELKNIIKKNYKVKNNSSPDNFNLFVDSMTSNEAYNKIIVANVDNLFEIDEVTQITVMKDITIADIIKHVNTDYHNILKSFVLIFVLMYNLSLMFQQSESDSDALFDKTLNILRAMQHNKPFDELLDEIVDDDIKMLLLDIDRVIVKKEDNLADMIENTKIGEIAKEISKDIDLSNLNLEKPEDILNFKNNNILGDIVSKVGSTLQSKFEKGELKHEELLREAMGMLGSMGGSGSSMLNNPLFRDLAASMAGASGSGGGKGTKARVDKSKLDALSTKERLRRKLAAKKEAAQVQSQSQSTDS